MTSRPNTPDVSRRTLLRGRRAPEHWLPWSDPQTLLGACTRCGRCEEACPHGVIVHGDGGFPRVDAHLGECTFCGACASACPAPVFDLSRTPAWPLRARVSEACIEYDGVVCRVCVDACPNDALRFRPLPGGRSDARADPQCCTGCGACVGRCPTAAITLKPNHDHGATTHE